MAKRRPINLQIATDAQFKSINNIDQSKSRRLIRKRDEKGLLLKEDCVECKGLSMEEVEELITQNMVDFDPVITKKELVDEIKTQLEPTLRSVKDTQIELQEAQIKIMEALSVTQQASQNKETFITQIDLQKLKQELSTEFNNKLVEEIKSIKTTHSKLQESQVKIMEALTAIQQAPQLKEQAIAPTDLLKLKQELSTEFKKELVAEVRNIYQEIAKISITPVNITQEWQNFAANLRKEIAEQLKGTREETKNTDNRLRKIQQTSITQINKDIVSLNQKYSTLDRKVTEASSEAKEERSIQMNELKSKLENMEEAVDKQRVETSERLKCLSEEVVHKLIVNTQVLDGQRRDMDERIDICKRKLTAEILEKQGEIQDVIFGLAVAITHPEVKLHNKNEDANSKQAASNNKLLEVINKWGTTHQPNKTSMVVTSTPKLKDDSFFNDFSGIQHHQTDKQLINEEDRSKNISHDSNSRSRGRSKSRRENTAVTQMSKSFSSKRMNKYSTKTHTRRFLSSSTESSYRQHSDRSSSDSSRCRSKSPQHPKMSTFDGTGKPSWESFIYQFERAANRRHWRSKRKTGRLLDCLKDIALEYARKVNKDDDYDAVRKKMKRRFSKKPEPVTARRQLQYVRQENESLEDFAHKVYVLALDGYEKCEDDALEDIATEAFLRGCKEKEAAIKAMEKNPVILSKAIKFIKTSLSNQKPIFGSPKTSLAQRQVTFSDTEGNHSKEKENSHAQRQTCLEQEIKNLSSLVGKLIEDNVIERRTERQMASSPVTGYTPGYNSPQRYMPQYRSQSPVQTYNSGRSAPQSVNLRPEWHSPNGRQHFSPKRGG